VEVAVALDAPVGEEHGVVDGARRLARGDGAGVGEQVARGAGDLRGTAEAVGVLNAGVLRPAMRLHDRRPVEEAAQVGPAVLLPGVRAQREQVGREDAVGAEQRLDAHRRGDVGNAQQGFEIRAREHQHGEHAVGAVDEGEALLLREDDRLDAGGGDRVGRGQDVVADADGALAHDGERRVRERRQVARATERPELADDRRDAGVQQRGVGLGGDAAHAGAAGEQCLQPQQHEAADHLPLDLRAGARGVRPDQAALQLGAPLRRDVPGRERPEAGGDAVHGVVCVSERVDRGASLVEAVERRVVERDGRAVARDRDERLLGDGPVGMEYDVHAVSLPPLPARVGTVGAMPHLDQLRRRRTSDLHPLTGGCRRRNTGGSRGGAHYGVEP
jgi:hypothetical protein